MFSDKVVCAIRVMNLLAYSPPGQRSARGIDSGFLKELLGVEFSLYKSVIITLTAANICYTTARMVYLSRGAERVTVYDLMYLFHKGIPLGASTEIDWNKGDYLHNKHYARLRHIETGMEEELRMRMRNMYVLALLGPEQEKTEERELDAKPAAGLPGVSGEAIRDNVSAPADRIPLKST